ncbi:MAG: UDP-N-acetylmuramoyl-tripeptide--D-alanyl-D-alanine ligase [Verrucomicrobia bacterium]|nr:UDP-N-acetylmuramoyl-tripeptide--D-alanyl-D-alanine ligase [Verrucomicrobiota bacterium]
MQEHTLAYVAAGCGGSLEHGDPAQIVRRACLDSREVQPGDLFVAIDGERFDGHDFLDEAVRRGAAALLVQRRKVCLARSDCALIAVRNTRRALGKLAARHRRDFNLPVVAVAGSNGKTTTKELIAAVLRQRFETLQSEGSFNNDIGVPLTLLKLEPRHQAAVLEAGTNHAGELAPLLRMIQPRLGVITNIGREHLEFFGNVASVADEEGTLAELLPADGKLFIHGDSEWAEPVSRRCRAPVERVGFGNDNPWRVSDLELDERGSNFAVHSPVAALNGRYRVNLLGRHQAINALFALAVGAELGLGREELRNGLADCHPPKMRLQLREINGLRVLDDSYNANADSMRAALQTLKEFPCRGRRLAALGDMGELGSHSAVAHGEVGRCAAESGVRQLFTIGRQASLMAAAAREGGLANVMEFSDVDQAALAIKAFAQPGDVLLLKASRSMRLERVVDVLRGEYEKAS